MTRQEGEAAVAQRLAGLRRIVLGVMIGVSVPVLGAVGLRLSGGVPDPTGRPLVSMLGLGVAICDYLAFLILPAAVTRLGRRRLVENPPTVWEAGLDLVRLGELYATITLIACLMLGGAAVFLTVGYLCDGFVFNLAAASASLVGVGMQYPAAGIAEAWIADQFRRVEEERRAAADSDPDDL
jgi:hypothetical protein